VVGEGIDTAEKCPAHAPRHALCPEKCTWSRLGLGAKLTIRKVWFPGLGFLGMTGPDKTPREGW
jgi:hypothetical protein